MLIFAFATLRLIVLFKKCEALLLGKVMLSSDHLARLLHTESMTSFEPELSRCLLLGDDNNNDGLNQNILNFCFCFS